MISDQRFIQANITNWAIQMVTICLQDHEDEPQICRKSGQKQSPLVSALKTAIYGYFTLVL